MSATRRVALGAAVLATVPAAGMVVLYAAPSLQLKHRLLAMAASFIPFALPLWAISLLLVLLGGRGKGRLWAIPVGVGLIAQTVWALPYAPHDPPEATGTPLRVLAINVQFGRGDADELAAEIQRTAPDVLVITEATDAFLARASAAVASYPYRAGSPAGSDWSAAGTVVFSKTPVSQLEKLPTQFDGLVVRVARPGVAVTLIAAHPVNPVFGTASWRDDAEVLRDAAQRYRDQPLVLAGDLNATLEHYTLRRMLSAGLTDAADQSGAGWLPTFSTETSPVPPLIAIDHVLVGSRVTAVGVTAFRLSGSDHLGLVADLRVR